MIGKRISYQEDSGRKNVKAAELIAKKPLPKDWKPKYLNGNVIDMTPMIDDEWQKIERPEPDDDDAKKREGIVSYLAQMTENQLREMYGGYLVPYGYREEDIMNMPIKELENLFNQVMNI